MRKRKPQPKRHRLSPVRSAFALNRLAIRMEMVADSLYKKAECINMIETKDPKYLSEQLAWPKFQIRDLRDLCVSMLRKL